MPVGDYPPGPKALETRFSFRGRSFLDVRVGFGAWFFGAHRLRRPALAFKSLRKRIEAFIRLVEHVFGPGAFFQYLLSDLHGSYDRQFKRGSFTRFLGGSAHFPVEIGRGFSDIIGISGIASEAELVIVNLDQNTVFSGHGRLAGKSLNRRETGVFTKKWGTSAISPYSRKPPLLRALPRGKAQYIVLWKICQPYIAHFLRISTFFQKSPLQEHPVWAENRCRLWRNLRNLIILPPVRAV